MTKMIHKLVNTPGLSNSAVYSKVLKKPNVNNGHSFLVDTTIQTKYTKETDAALDELDNAVEADGGTIPKPPDEVVIPPNAGSVRLTGDGLYIEVDKEQ